MKDTDADGDTRPFDSIGSNLLESDGPSIWRLSDGPLREATRGDAKSLLLVTTLALITKSALGASTLAWISGPLTFKAQTVPFLLTVMVVYFLAVFLLRSASDILVWWPTWRALTKTMIKGSRAIVAFVAMRFALDFCVPVVFAIFAL